MPELAGFLCGLFASKEVRLLGPNMMHEPSVKGKILIEAH